MLNSRFSTFLDDAFSIPQKFFFEFSITRSLSKFIITARTEQTIPFQKYVAKITPFLSCDVSATP